MTWADYTEADDLRADIAEMEACGSELTDRQWQELQRMRDQLWRLESDIAQDEAALDRAYGQWLTL